MCWLEQVLDHTFDEIEQSVNVYRLESSKPSNQFSGGCTSQLPRSGAALGDIPVALTLADEICQGHEFSIHFTNFLTIAFNRNLD